MGFRVQGSGFRVQGLGFMVLLPALHHLVEGYGFGVWGNTVEFEAFVASAVRAEVLGFRVGP